MSSKNWARSQKMQCSTILAIKLLRWTRCYGGLSSVLRFHRINGEIVSTTFNCFALASPALQRLAAFSTVIRVLIKVSPLERECVQTVGIWTWNPSLQWEVWSSTLARGSGHLICLYCCFYGSGVYVDHTQCLMIMKSPVVSLNQVWEIHSWPLESRAPFMRIVYLSSLYLKFQFTFVFTVYQAWWCTRHISDLQIAVWERLRVWVFRTKHAL